MYDNDIGRARTLSAKWYYKELWGWDLEEICTGPVRGVFLKSLLTCANGDGVLSEAEREWVVGRAATAGAPEGLIDELLDYRADEDINQLVSSTLATNSSRNAVVYFAIKAASSDGEYSGQEQIELRNIAQSMGISDEQIMEIEDLCAEEEALKQKRIDICFPDGNPFGL